MIITELNPNFEVITDLDPAKSVGYDQIRIRNTASVRLLYAIRFEEDCTGGWRARYRTGLDTLLS